MKKMVAHYEVGRVRRADGKFEASLGLKTQTQKHPQEGHDNESFVEWEKTTPEARKYMFSNVTILETVKVNEGGGGG